MAKTLTMVLTSGSQENDDARFAVGLAEAALDRGHRVNLFLYGNGCNLANQEVAFPGPLGIRPSLQAHMDSQRLAARIATLAKRGAKITTCHTTEYGRGTEGLPYLPGVARGDVGHSFTDFLVGTDVLICLGR